MVRNYSKDSEYHSQRNNRIIPHSSCNTTAMVMALKQAGVRLPFPEGIQPEDYLTRFFQSEKALKKMEDLAPWAINRANGKSLYLPQEIHAVLAWGVNYLLNKKVVTFSTETLLETIISTVDNGGGVVLSGHFPLKSRSIHHMVSLAGYMEHQNDVTYLIIDDPYGDYKTDYRSHRGNNIPITIEKSLKIFKPTESLRKKWAHCISNH